MSARYAAGSSPRRISSSLIRSSHMAWVNGVTGAKCCLTTRRRSNHIYHVHHRLPLCQNAHLEVRDTSVLFVSILLKIHVIFMTMSGHILVKNRSSARSAAKDLHVNRICVNTWEPIHASSFISVKFVEKGLISPLTSTDTCSLILERNHTSVIYAARPSLIQAISLGTSVAYTLERNPSYARSVAGLLHIQVISQLTWGSTQVTCSSAMSVITLL